MSLTNLSKVTTSGIATGTSLLISNVNSSGVVTASSFSGPLSGDATGLSGTPNITVGVVTASSVTISGDLTVEGTYSTLDTILTEVDKLEVAANNSTVGVAITQSGTGDILRLYDSSTQAVTVADGGNVGIGTDDPTVESGFTKVLHVYSDSPQVLLERETDSGNVRAGFNAWSGNASLETFTTTPLKIRTSGNTNQLYLNTNGNVGIGTDAPDEKLEVYGGNIQQYNENASGGTGLILHNYAAGGGGNTLPYSFIRAKSNPVRNAGEIRFGRDSAYGSAAEADSHISFWTAKDDTNTERLRITSGGNVGIGTDNPVANFKLDVNGDLSLGEFSGTDDSFIDQKQDGHFDIINSGRQANNGRIRINRVNSISGDTTYYRDFEVYDGKGTLLFMTDGSSGNVGIGTDTPDKKLRVEGDARITGTLTVGNSSITLDGTNNKITVGSGTTIYGNNGIGIGTTNAENYTLNVNGTAGITGHIKTELEYPTVKPSYNFDFVHYPKLDSRLSFSRDSGAYRYSNKKVKTEENLLLNSQDFSQSWSIGNAISDISLETSVAAPDGTLTAYKITADGTNTWHGVDQSFNGDGGPFIWSIFAKAGTESHLQLRTNSTPAGYANFDLGRGALGTYSTMIPKIEDYGNGWYRCSVKVVAGDTVHLTFEVCQNEVGGRAGANSASGYIYVWGGQAEYSDEITGYVKTTTSAVVKYETLYEYVDSHVPRLEYDIDTRQPLGLLIEESRTNYYTHSQNYADSDWSPKNVTVRSNYAIAPDGTQTADRLESTNTDPYLYQSRTLQNGTTYTLSLWAKGVGSTIGKRFEIRIGTGSAGKTLTDKWQRFTHTYTFSGTTGNYNVGIEIPDGGSPTPIDGDAVYVWGMQLEIGNYATSYIKTEDSTTSRAGEEISLFGDEFEEIFNQNSWTVYAEHTWGPAGTTTATPVLNARAVFSLSGLYSDTMNLYNGSGVAAFYASNGLSQQAFLSMGAKDGGVYHKSAVSYDGSELNATTNGETIQTDTTVNLYDNIKIMYLGANVNLAAADPPDILPTPGSYRLNGHIKSFKIYPTSLPDNVLTTITS